MSDLGNKLTMAKNIQYYMSLNNKSRSDVCEAIGVKYTTFTDWVKGNTYPRIDKIELMANYFGVSKSDLVEEHISDPQYDKTFESNMFIALKRLLISKKAGSTKLYTPLKELNSIQEELSVYGLSPKAIRYSKMLDILSIQQLLDAASGCNDEQIQIAVRMLNAFKKEE